MENNNNGGKKLVLIVGLVIIVAVILAVWLSVKKPEGGEENRATLGFTAAREANRDAVLEIPDQFPGNIVYVSRADFPAGAWVRIQEIADDIVSAPIGSAFFDQNTKIGTIDLTMPTEDGRDYLAQAFTDDGDGVFTDQDAVINQISVRFRATRDLPEKKG